MEDEGFVIREICEQNYAFYLREGRQNKRVLYVVCVRWIRECRKDRGYEKCKDILPVSVLIRARGPGNVLAAGWA